jgi:hypothetical protein
MRSCTEQIYLVTYTALVVLGVRVVIVVAIRPKVRGLKPGRERRVLKTIKIHSTISFGGKVNLSAPCRKILRHVKYPCAV